MNPHATPRLRAVLLAMLTCLLATLSAGAQQPEPATPDTLHAAPKHHTRRPVAGVPELPGVRVVNAAGDTIALADDIALDGLDGVEVLAPPAPVTATPGNARTFNPDPKRALWLSALCPGLGQVYNRRYWKLPIVAGAFVGLSYGTSWNNRMLADYTRAYRDAMDSDPETRSYMNFYPPTTQESDLDMEWLKKALKNKKSYYRRYRDICIIGMVAVYALCIVDAYVDASLAHFDISPDLSMQVRPAVVEPASPTLSRTPTLGLQCAVTF